MSYITAVTASGDRAGFVSGGSTVKDVISGLGASSCIGAQLIMGGDNAGMLQVQYRTDTAEQAMTCSEGAIANSDIQAYMQSWNAQIQRRSLLRLNGERGSMAGTYGIGSLISGGPVGDDAIQASLDNAWGVVSDSVNGIGFATSVAAGASASVAPYYAFVWGDDLDAMIDAMGRNLADSKTQQFMSNSGITPLGRIIGKTLF
tara:strand:+ start:112 stop:720 length:609 start_codon:yes stop_codon:yes gene_type:complete